MKYKITVPNPKYNGFLAGVEFKNGTGYTTDKKLASYFESVWNFEVKQERKKKGDTNA